MLLPQNIPVELRRLAQWVVWQAVPLPSGKTDKIPINARTHRKADVTNENEWSSYETALATYERGNGWYAGLGFCLSHESRIVGFDFDATDKPELIQAHNEIFHAFPTYAERTPSGKGCRMFAYGDLPGDGTKRSDLCFELYAAKRFLTVTGNVIRPLPLAEFNGTLTKLYEQIAPKQQTGIVTDEPETYTDAQIWQMAANAANADKFLRLFNGDTTGYPAGSQNEADLALFNILRFYTKNYAQAVRIFQRSALGQRQKAHRADYLETMWVKSADLEPPKIDSSAISEQIKAQLEATPIQPETPEPLPFPPGKLGDVARFIFERSPHPFPEIAVAAAFGMIAGIAARAYTISGIGLNDYYLCLAPTGTGKDAGRKGINFLVNRIRNPHSNASSFGGIPAIDEFFGPEKLVSAEGLIKRLHKNRCFVSMLGEFGLTLRNLSAKNATETSRNLLETLLRFYSLNAPYEQFRAASYSDSNKSLPNIESPALSVLGEGTPETFYEGISDRDIATGLIPRFVILEFTGERAERNVHFHSVEPTPDLIHALSMLTDSALKLNYENQTYTVLTNSEAQTVLDAFEQKCAQAMRGQKEVYRQLWSRAYLHALKAAALMAALENPFQPCIDGWQADYAVQLIRRSVRMILERFESGETGELATDVRQYNRLIEILKLYVQTPFNATDDKYGTTSTLKQKYIIPYSYLHRRLAPTSVFLHDKMGATYALKRALDSAVRYGVLARYSENNTPSDLKTYLRGECYQITAVLNDLLAVS